MAALIRYWDLLNEWYDTHRERLLTWWVVLFTAVVLIGLYEANVARRSLCSFRSDLAHRITKDEQTLEFLRKHHGGFAGLPPVTIQASIISQQNNISDEMRTYKSLHGLGC